MTKEQAWGENVSMCVCVFLQQDISTAENVVCWGGAALICASFEVLIGKQPQKAELISNLEL